MSEKHPQHSEKRTEGLMPTPGAQAARMLREIAEPRPVGDTVKAAITRAARAVSAAMNPPGRKLTYGRAEDIWRGEARRIDAAEMDAIRTAHESRDRSLRAELREASLLADRLERLAARAVPMSDPGLDAEIRNATRQAKRTARALRGLAVEEPGRPGAAQSRDPVTASTRTALSG